MVDSGEEIEVPVSTNNNAQQEETPGEAVDITSRGILNDEKPPQQQHEGLHEDLGLVLQSIREVVSCCACFNSDFSMKECANGHLLCHTCFLTLRQDEHPQCPTCRATLYPDTKKALIAQKVLSELPDPCPACGQTMLFKDLAGHKFNDCPKRRVACGLAPLGCAWCGSADEYQDHYAECEMKRSLSERPLEENLDNVLARFRRREQAIRETFACFSSVFRHLEGFEVTSVSVPLSMTREAPGKLVFKSDQFHGSQSRWTLELVVAFEENIPEESPILRDDVSSTEDLPADDVTIAEQMNSSHSPSDSSPPIADIGDRISVLPIRQRRGLRFSAVSRARPYPEWTRSRSSNGNSNSNNITITTGLSADRITASENVNSPNQTQQFGTMTFSVTKDNSPGIGRKSYSFIPLQIESPERGAQVSLRPRVSSHRFISRGERTGVFSLCPMRWRYLTHLSELKLCRLLNLEMAIARRLVDDQADPI